ncbi:choice-of-anchor B family protein [Candidatus Palauibacter sp.]|uniref:choice-of-anchor B family protein n=1 Tax=Candidatus Palauibacter sp. TaxID=3101350 RepID=UPI003B0291FD
MGTIPDQTIATGQTATLEIVSYFNDPDGGALTYTAATNAAAVVSVAVTGGTLTLVGVTAGTASVTVKATDPAGLTAAQGFRVTVETPNRSPEAVGTIPARTLTVGQSATLDVSPFVTDPDGDALTYTAASSAAAVVTVTVSGSVLTLVGVTAGTASVTVTAADPAGLTAAQGFQVTVETPNRAPEAVGTIPARTLTVGQSATLDVSPFVTDPDGDALTYTAASSAAAVVTVTVSGGTLTLVGVATGTAIVTVTAADPAGLTAAHGILVTVETSSKVKPCIGGSAAGYPCSRVDLVSRLSREELGVTVGIVNDMWGWTDPATGTEWALVGHSGGTAFVSLEDPENPVYAGFLPFTQGARPSIWRDIKVYRDHAYIVADDAGAHGMQVVDLTRLRDISTTPSRLEAVAVYNRIHSAHNVAVNEETGFAYAVGASGGGETCGGGLHMIDIRNPTSPVFAGCFADPRTGRASTGYTHDAACVVYRGPDTGHRGSEICFGSNETALSIVDVSNKQRPRALAAASYPQVGYTHQGWLDEAQEYFYMNDEFDELNGKPRPRTIVWDVSDLDDPIVAAEYMGTTGAIDHNLYIAGNLMYQSNYLSGLRVVDISNRENPREVGYFDVEPAFAEIAMDGSWSNYPFFASGIIGVTSTGRALGYKTSNGGVFFVRLSGN